MGGEKVVIFYFTGNSLYVAKNLEDERVSIAQAIHDNKKVYKAEKIGIVCPIFGHEVPQLVRQFLEQATFETSYFYMVLTYGRRHGGASLLAKNMLDKIGIKPSYINVLLMVDNFLPSFDMNEQRAMDKNVEGQLKQIKSDIDKKREYISPVTQKDREAHQEYLDKMEKVLKAKLPNMYQITDECIGCEICTKICPKNCFTMKNNKSVWNSNGCISCMACIHACPMIAIQLNMPEKNKKARYRNDNISICEIIDANNQLNF